MDSPRFGPERFLVQAATPHIGLWHRYDAHFCPDLHRLITQGRNHCSLNSNDGGSPTSIWQCLLDGAPAQRRITIALNDSDSLAVKASCIGERTRCRFMLVLVPLTLAINIAPPRARTS